MEEGRGIKNRDSDGLMKLRNNPKLRIFSDNTKPHIFIIRPREMVSSKKNQDMWDATESGGDTSKYSDEFLYSRIRSVLDDEDDGFEPSVIQVLTYNPLKLLTAQENYPKDDTKWPWTDDTISYDEYLDTWPGDKLYTSHRGKVLIQYEPADPCRKDREMARWRFWHDANGRSLVYASKFP